MKTMGKSIVLFFATAMLSLLACAGVSAASATGYFTYENYENGVKVTAYSGAEKTMSIPDSLGGKKVLAVGANMMQYKDDVENVILPKYLVTIEANAFLNCSKLKEVTFGSKVTTIGDSAFSGCVMLEYIDFPKSVRTIGNNAFFNTGIEDLEIPGTVETIGVSAFASCNRLMDVVINNGTRTIGNNAFYNCLRLESLQIPVSVTAIGNDLVSTASSFDTVLYVYQRSYADSCFQDYNRTHAGTPYDIEYLDLVNATKVTFPKKTIQMYVGQQQKLSVTVKPKGYTDAIQWKSYNEAVVKVDTYGNVSAENTGTATVRATAVKGAATKDDKYASVTIKVLKAPTSVTLTRADKKKTNVIKVGKTVTLKANIEPERSANAPLTTVKSSNTKVAVITDKEKLTVKGVREGTATITVKTYNGKKATYKVTVTKDRKPMAGWTQTSMTVLAGNTKKFNGVTSKMKFSSSDSSVATVNKKGVVTGVSGGTATITIIEGNYEAKCKVTVKSPDINSTWIIDSAVQGKKASIKYVKVTGVDGYQVSWRKKGEDYSDKNASKRSAGRSNWVTFTNFDANSVYYVRVRTYKVINGQKAYSDWSTALRIKTKN